MTHKFFLALSALLGLIACTSVPEAKLPQPTASQTAAIDSLGERYATLNRFAGVILIAQDDKLILERYYGLADYERLKPFTDDYAFELGHLSELITASIAREMEQQGQLDLSRPVSDYLPEIQVEYSVADLIEHRSGLPSIAQVEALYPDTPYHTLSYLRLLPDSLPPAENSDLAYNLLGLLLESVSDQPLEVLVQETAMAFGLQHSYYQLPDSSAPKGYLYRNFGNDSLERRVAGNYDLEKAFASRGMKASASDLLAWSQLAFDGPLNYFGYLTEGGFSYSLQRDSSGHSIIILSNHRHPVAREMSESVAAILKGTSYRLPPLRRALPLPDSIMAQYAGHYQLDADVILAVKHRPDSLFLQLGARQIPLTPQREDQFFLPASEAAIRFVRDSSGVLSHALLLDGFLEGQRIERLKPDENLDLDSIPN